MKNVKKVCFLKVIERQSTVLLLEKTRNDSNEAGVDKECG